MADEVKHAARAALPGDPPRACTCSNPEHCAALHALHECTLSCTKVVVIIVLSIARLSTESASLYPFGPSNLGAADATPRLTKPPWWWAAEPPPRSAFDVVCWKVDARNGLSSAEPHA